jgi:hypothetical protein
MGDTIGTTTSKTGSGLLTFTNTDTAENVQRFIDDLCNDPVFLCSNKAVCATSKQQGTVDDINKTCQRIADANVCDNVINECVVQVNNSTFDSEVISTSFVNIILPIKNEFDKNGNHKFLRLPALSSSKNPKPNAICNICSCVSRFATSGTSPVTSPGLKTCEYNNKTIETVYYPVDVENVNSKLKNAPPAKIGKYNVLSSNIIYASSDDDLEVCNLYNLLIENGILEYNAVQFIKNLYQSDPSISKKIEKCIQENTLKNKGNGAFYQNISFFYITFAIFLVIFISILN